MTQPTESDYRTAQLSSTKVKQEFCAEFSFGDRGEFVRRVIYDPKKVPVAQIFSTSACTRSPSLLKRFFTKKSDIYLYPKIWANSYNMFCSILGDHEEYHAAANAQRGGVVIWKSITDKSPDSPEYFYFLEEAFACLAQLEHSDERMLTQSEVREISERLSFNSSEVGKRAKDKDIQRDLEILYLPQPRDRLARERLPTLLTHCKS